MHSPMEETPSFANAPAALSVLEYDTLIDVLEQKVRVYLSASKTDIADKEFIEQIHAEILSIQAEVKKRLDSLPGRR